MRMLDEQRLDKEAFEVVDMHSDSGLASDDWRAKSPLERLEGLEILRQMWSDYDPDTARLPRVYTVVEQTRS